MYIDSINSLVRYNMVLCSCITKSNRGYRCVKNQCSPTWPFFSLMVLLYIRFQFKESNPWSCVEIQCPRSYLGCGLTW
jgi:hypothetical protein